MESGTTVQLSEIMEIVKAPSTYQEWLEYLKWMESHNVRGEDIDRIGEGRIPRGGLLQESFQKRIVATVNAMLRRYIRNFNRALNDALERNEFESVQMLCTRMQRDLEYCFFYRRITFLDAEFTKKLDSVLTEQVLAFWQHVIKEMSRITMQTEAADADEVIVSLLRLKKKYGR